MTTDQATAWLTACGYCPTADEGPLRPEPTYERIAPGDVLDDGTILATAIGPVDGGRIWLTAPQARAAAYYGWTVTSGRSRQPDGQPVFLVEKWPAK